MEWTAHSIHSASYQDITHEQKIEIQTDAEERYLAYIFLKQSAKKSEKLRTNLSDNYATEENKYPTSCQETLHYLEKHSRIVVRALITKEGSSFAKRKGNGSPNTFEKKYWKVKECYKCGDKGHPASHYKTKLDINGKKKKKDDNISLVSRKSSTHTMVGKMKEDLQKTNKSFTAMECMIKNIEDISDSDSESGLEFFKWNATSSPPLERIS